jgi:hypothetical protein
MTRVPPIISRSLATAAGLAAVLLLPARAMTAGALPSLDSPELGHGPFSSMHMLLQKTLLKINVANIDLRFDKATQSKLAALASGKAYSYELDYQLARVAIAAPHAVVQMQFVRDIPLNRWIGVVRDNMELAREAGLIGRDLEQKVSDGIPQWFAPLADRGYKKGDRLLYEITPSSFRTAVVSEGGQVLLDMGEHEAGSRRVVLSSYFAPKSDTREPLIRSLWESR